MATPDEGRGGGKGGDSLTFREGGPECGEKLTPSDLRFCQTKMGKGSKRTMTKGVNWIENQVQNFIQNDSKVCQMTFFANFGGKLDQT